MGRAARCKQVLRAAMCGNMHLTILQNKNNKNAAVFERAIMAHMLTAEGFYYVIETPDRGLLSSDRQKVKDYAPHREWLSSALDIDNAHCKTPCPVATTENLHLVP